MFAKKPICSRFFAGHLVLNLLLIKVLLALPLGVCTAVAQPKVNMQQAIAKSLASHPELVTLGYRLKSTEALIEQAGVGQRKTLNIGVENLVGDQDLEGADRRQASIGIAWVLEGEVLQARQASARKEYTLAQRKLDSKKIDIAAQTALAFLKVLYYQEQKNIERQWSEDVARMYSNTEKLVAAGHSRVADKYRAQATLTLSQLELEHVEHEIDTAYRQLVAHWGGEGEENFQAKGNLYSVVAIGDIDEIRLSIENNKQFAILQAKQKLAESEVAYFKREAKSKLGFNAGLRRHADTQDFSVSAGLSIPLGSEKRNRGKIQSLRSEVSAGQSEAQALGIALETRLYEYFYSYQHAVHVVEALSGEVIPALEKALGETEKAYNSGGSSFQDWIIIRKELSDSKLMLLEAYLLSHVNRIEIERLTSSSIAQRS